MNIVSRLRKLEENQDSTHVVLDQIPKDSTLEEATCIYNENLRRLKSAPRVLSNQSSMSLEKATRLYRQSLEQWSHQ